MNLEPISFRILKREAPNFARLLKKLSRASGIPVEDMDIYRDGDDYVVIRPDQKLSPGGPGKAPRFNYFNDLVGSPGKSAYLYGDEQ
ncbi:hypothetical protein [Govanella unica]|uniref:Uncharacterized protein n=1 Tax=Govanella unica TaxID=2975056 RepID=A0A9X3TW43_9PROT|nr:hypothetical protein [Govania unica]MDA5192517.1 hypothetical protein [Govania unica]